MFKIPIKEYLVKVGFAIDKGELNDALNFMDSTIGKVKSSASSLNKNLSSASGAILGFVAAASAGTLKLLDNIADADMQTELLARRMWMSEEAVRGLSAATDVLGMSINDLNEIAINPELRAQFQELYGLTKELQAPKELQNQLKMIRSITFEFKKFRLIVNYGLQQIAYYLNKYLGDRLAKIKQSLQDANNWLVKNMPKIASTIGKWLYYILRILETILIILGRIVKFIYQTFDDLPRRGKIAFLGLAAAAFIALKPFNLILIAIGALLLLLEDYVSFTQGKKSALGGLWQAMSENTALDSLSESFSSLINLISELIGLFVDLYEAFSDATGVDVIDVLTFSFNALGNAANYAAESIEKVLGFWKSLSTGDFKGAFGNFADIAKSISLFSPGIPASSVTNLARNISKYATQNINMTVKSDNANKMATDMNRIFSMYANQQLSSIY